MKINAFLIQKLNKSSIEIKKLINEKRVLIDDFPALQKQKITYKNSVNFDGKIIQAKDVFFYFAYYKPIGIESTMNKTIENNLFSAVNISTNFFPVGRLDKYSEGLMILTNNGELCNSIISPFEKVEKEYVVIVNKVVNNNFIELMKSGVEILGKKTKECYAEKISEYCFRIILTEGRNRQIRRMCYKLGFDVVQLKRVRIGKLVLGDLKSGDLLQVNQIEK